MENWAIVTFRQGKLKRASTAELDINTKIREIDQEVYFGIDTWNGIQHRKIKQKILKQCYKRIIIPIVTASQDVTEGEVSSK